MNGVSLFFFACAAGALVLGKPRATLLFLALLGLYELL